MALGRKVLSCLCTTASTLGSMLSPQVSEPTGLSCTRNCHTLTISLIKGMHCRPALPWWPQCQSPATVHAQRNHMSYSRVDAADVDIDTLPRRRTDNARILDTSKNTVKLYTSDGGTKLLRRQDGRVERQHRLNIGTLPVAYTSDGADNLLYIMDRAVTCYSHAGEQARNRQTHAVRHAVSSPATAAGFDS